MGEAATSSMLLTTHLVPLPAPVRRSVLSPPAWKCTDCPKHFSTDDSRTGPACSPRSQLPSQGPPVHFYFLTWQEHSDFFIFELNLIEQSLSSFQCHLLYSFANTKKPAEKSICSQTRYLFQLSMSIIIKSTTRWLCILPTQALRLWAQASACPV